MANTNDSEFDEDVDIGFRIACRLGGIIAKDEEDDVDRELYGISPMAITIVMVLVTLVFPVGGFGFVYNNTPMEPLLYGVYWITDVYSVFYAFFLVHS